MVKLTGADRASFLNGQVTSDVLNLAPAQHACLLNNTGHLLAEIFIHSFEDSLLIETDPERAQTVAAALERFLVRERVEIEVLTDVWKIASFQGAVTGREKAGSGFVAHRNRTGAPGADFWSLDPLPATNDVASLDEDTLNVLRVEAGVPWWGRELDESVIPLEAGMQDAISFTKGCYMGQEVIARIHSRGHTNRTLKGLKLSVPVTEEEGFEAGRITSSVVSPAFGPIALAYVRNEYAAAGTLLQVGPATATVADLPFLNHPDEGQLPASGE